MTSQQDTELRDIVRALLKQHTQPTVNDDVDRFIELFTSWKDKEVERALMGEICPYHDVWDWRKHRAKLESLQSQGGK